MTAFPLKQDGPLSVLHVVPKLSASGGVGNQLLALLGQYDRTKFSPVVCSLREKGEVGSEIEKLGIKVICLNWEFKKGFYFGIVRKLREIISRDNVQIVRTHEYRANLHGCIAARLAGVPCIVASVHNVYMPRDKKITRRLTNKFLSLIADKVVAVSGAVKNDIVQYDGVSGKKVVVIYNGVNEDKFICADGNSVRKEFNIPRQSPVIGAIGRLFPQKGHRYLLEAVAMIKDEFPGLRLLIVGDGPLLNELTEYTKAGNISENVIFTGSRRDIPGVLAAMDIFVFPSLWEGFGNALIEAMAAGKPVVATDIPAAREILNAEDMAMIVSTEDPSAIAGALTRLITDRPFAAALGFKARQRALASFTISRVFDTYRSLFESILKGKGLC